MSSPVRPDSYDELLRRRQAEAVSADTALTDPYEELLRRRQLPARETLSRVPNRSVKGTLKALGLGAANFFTAKALPQLVGAVQAAGHPLSYREKYRQGVQNTQQALNAAQASDPEAFTGGEVLGFAGQAAVPVAKGAQGLRAMAAAGRNAGLAFGGLSGLSQTDAESSVGEILKKTGTGALAGGAVGYPLGAVGGAAAAEIGPTVQNLARRFQGARQAPPLMSQAAREPVRTSTLAAPRLSDRAAGQKQLEDAVIRRQTNVPRINAERAGLLPEIRRHTPVLAHMGPEEIGRVWAPGTAVEPKIATKAGVDMDALHRLRRRAGDEMDRILVPTDIDGRNYAPLVKGQGSHKAIAEYLSKEAADSPVVLDAILDASDTVYGLGREAGYGSRHADVLRRAMRAEGIPDENINQAIAREMLDAPWTMEVVNELRKSVGRVASKGLQPGQANTSYAKRLAQFNDGVMDLLYASATGPRLKRAVDQYRQGGNVLESMMQRTGAQRVTNIEGKKNWVVPTHSPKPGSISTPAARFVGDVLVPTGNKAIISSAGAVAGTIAALREGPQYLRRKAVAEGAKLLLRSGERGTKVLQNLQKRTQPVPKAPLAPAKRAGANIAGAALPNIFAKPDPDDEEYP